MSRSARVPRPTTLVAVAALALMVVVLGGGATPARAGGSWLDPVLDRYEPGEVVTLVGYVARGQLGWIDDGPFLAYLRAGVVQPSNQTFSADGLPLGPLTVEPAHERPALRVSVSFRLPASLLSGTYAVTYCNDPCTNGLGDLVGGRLSVGADPPAPFVRYWLLDEPEIANLAPAALLGGPGWVATAEQVRAGSIPAPEPSPARPTTVAPPPPTVAAADAPVRPASTLPPIGAASALPARHTDANDRWFVILGSALAAICTLSVLLALRSGPRRPAVGGTEDLRELEPVGAGRGS